MNEFTGQLRVRYFKGFFQQPPWQFAGKDSAYYLTKLTTDAEAAAEKYCESILRIYKAVWSLVISIAVIAFTRWELAVYVFVFSFLSVNLPKLFQKEAVSAEQDYLDSSNAHMAQAQESIRNYLLIRLHGLAASRVGKYGDAAADLEKKDTARQKKYFAMDMAAGGISSLSFVLIIVFAMILVLQGKLSVGYTMSVSQLLGGIMLPFEVLPGYLLAFRAGRELYRANEAEFGDAGARGNGFEDPGIQESGFGDVGKHAIEPGSGCAQETKLGFDRTRDMEIREAEMQRLKSEDSKARVTEAGNSRLRKAGIGDVSILAAGKELQAGALCPPPESGLIRVNNLDFAYRDAAPLLRGISLSLNMNRKYALVGASGSGKNTLSKLIMGFLPTEEGKISINGIPLEKMPRQALYEMISYQSQNVTFFQDTLRNNICLGVELSESGLKRVIKAASLEAFVETLPEGADSLIREDGKNISGGEAQRIGLTRSLAKGCRFMIFDEIAAALDNQTALEVEKAVLALPDVGMLMITHRIFEENMRLYDRIFVLKEGRISEAGAWEELMEKKRDFYRLAAVEQGA